MRFCALFFAAIGCLLGGCAGEARLNPGMTMSARQQEYLDNWSVRSATDANAARAVIVEHTLYPYEFEGESAALTQVGRRDVSVLADYYKNHPGALTVVRGDASEELYQQRSAAVRQAFKEAGADESQIAISDGRPAGDGITGREILDGYDADRKSGAQGSAETSGGAGGSTSGASSGEMK